MDIGTGILLVVALGFGGRGLWNAHVQPILDARPVAVPQWESLAMAGHSSGADDAPVTILWFADYECPACRSMKPELEAMLAQLGDTVRFIHRHWPLEYHASAYPAARAAECAGEQGMFWAFHHALFSEAQWLTSGDFGTLARGVGIPDLTGFASCAAEVDPVPAIEADVEAVALAGGTGTPTVLVNGLMLRRLDMEYVLETVRQEAGRTPQ